MIVLVIVLAVLAVIALVVALVDPVAPRRPADRHRRGRRRRRSRPPPSAMPSTPAPSPPNRHATKPRSTRPTPRRRRRRRTQRQPTAEARAADAAARNGLDPDLLWTLERARSERTWRQSVALGAETASVFDGSDHPLREALQIELDAAREDVGAIVDLDLDVPPDVTAAGSVLVLRAAQELLARAVKTAEQTTLHVRADGPDVVVTIEAADHEGTPVELEPLAVPTSADLDATDGGVRIRRAIPGEG